MTLSTHSSNYHSLQSERVLLDGFCDEPFLSRRQQQQNGSNASVLSSSFVCSFLPVARQLASMADRFASTGDDYLDTILHGGLRVGSVTELFGEASAGKTQLVLQCLVTAAARGETVILLVSEDVPIDRLQQLAACAGSRVGLDAEALLKQVLIRKVYHAEDLDQLFNSNRELETLIKQRQVSVVALDSVACALNDSGSGPVLQNARFLYTLKTFVSRCQVAFLVTNHVRSVENEIRPMLGLTWSQAVHTRVGLRRNVSGRTIQVGYSCNVAPVIAGLAIDESGVHAFSLQ